MSKYVDVDALVRVALQSLAFAAVLACVYGLGVVGLSRSGAVAGAGAGPRRTAPLLVAGLAFAVFAAAIALGIGIMASK